MERRAVLSAGLLSLWFAVALGGCHSEGPAEKAGKKIDHATEKAGNAMEEAGDKAKERTER
jgi:hypothetical protein